MKSTLSREDAQAFRARWDMVNAAEQAELRTTSLSQKLHQLAALMGSVQSLGWSEALAAEETEVRARWTRLRKLVNG